MSPLVNIIYINVETKTAVSTNNIVYKIDLFNSYINTTVLLPEKHFNKVIKYDSLYSFVYSFEEKPKFR